MAIETAIVVPVEDELTMAGAPVLPAFILNVKELGGSGEVAAGCVPNC